MCNNQKATQEQFSAVQNIYDYFNARMFNGELNGCILNFSRKSKAYGFFAPERWSAAQGERTPIHEISLNPEHLTREPRAVVSTLVHEMAHLWQQDFGKPSPGYHNKQWAAKMKEIGLYPSSTGAEGGKETGKNCSHYILEDGLFAELWEAMPKEFLYPFVCVAEYSAGKEKSKAKNKVKYTCPECKANIWGKPELHVICQDCETAYQEA